MAKVDDLLQKASRAYKRGDKHTAARLLRELLAHNPQHAIAWYGLAMCTDDPAERRLYLQKALEIAPNYEAARRQLQRLKTPHRDSTRTMVSVWWRALPWIVFLLFIITCTLCLDTGYRTYWNYSIQMRATSTYEACVNQFYDEMLLLLSRFFRQQSIAERTPRINLAEQIARLEDIRSEAWNMPTKWCRPRIHARLMDYMDKSIAAYSEFLGENDVESMTLLIESWKALAELDDEVIRDGKRGGLVSLFRAKGYFYWEGLDDPKWKEKLQKQ